MDDFFFFFFDEEDGAARPASPEELKLSSPILKHFENVDVRVVWNETTEKYYYSVVDVVQILTDSVDAAAYWRKLKQRLKEEGNETVTNCHELKLKAADGKMRLTDITDEEQLLRIIQSIPSPKAEPFKIWMAKVASERLDEIADPELAISRALNTYRRRGYSEDWINQRLKTIDTRKALTDEWQRVGISAGIQFANLTDEMTKAWSGLTTREYKDYKDLKKENLRDNMNNLELILNMLAEATTTELSKVKDPDSFRESKEIAKEGGNVAGNARKDIEQRTGNQIVSPQNSGKINRLK